MKAKDITDARATHGQSVPFAVKVPRIRYGRRDGTDIIKASIEGMRDGKVRLNSQHHALVPYASVIDTWDAYELDKAHSEALIMNRRRDEMIEYEAKREANNAHVLENILPAFRGLMVQPTGSANFQRDDIDMADEIERFFCTQRSASIQVSQDWFEAIAGRIRAMQLDLQDAYRIDWSDTTEPEED
jgi:hypothetical protein